MRLTVIYSVGVDVAIITLVKIKLISEASLHEREVVNKLSVHDFVSQAYDQSKWLPRMPVFVSVTTDSSQS